ncbi:MAG: cob(I)yrinic acid a,c-diamide adenosyltransferase [Candidatus Omnitrophica bacterium]|nr:cob(I)yrinic acid a,c-diamide adenosyltransferase [Candidatus Omnitrophota bacterium]MCM8827794.1 cob(I)yrinic acid a,c-diamide adenosyltransferase [Candidatus Omnitrophota bacterium]
MNEKGLVIVFSGNGKGKTSAAIGISTRMAGWGKKVVYCAFFKKGSSGEFRTLKKIRGCRVLMFCCEHPAFSKDLEEEKFRKYFRSEWDRFLKKFSAIKKCDLLVLDEILVSVRDKLLNDTEIISFIDGAKRRDPITNFILTGRGITEGIIEIADIVTEMRCIKHPYPAMCAKKGVDW